MKHYFNLAFFIFAPFVLWSCTSRTTVVYQTNPQVTPTNLITKEVNILSNPLTDEVINCPVVADLTLGDNPWAKIDNEQLRFINIIKRDTSGRMWLATDGRGLTMFDGQKWHNWQPETHSDMSYDALRTMDVGETKVFAGAYGSSSGGNLLIYDIEGDKWETVEPGEGPLSGNVIGGVAINQVGDVFAVTTAGVDIYHEGQWQKFAKPDSQTFAMLMVEDALFDKKGNYWVATGQMTGVWKFDGQTWTTFTAEDGYLPSNHVIALAQDSQDRIWAATTEGLAVYDTNGEWYVFSNEQYPWFSGWIKAIAVDDADRVWVINKDYLTVYNGQEVAVFEPTVAGSGMWDNAIGFDEHGCVWIDQSSSRLIILRAKLMMDVAEFNFK